MKPRRLLPYLIALLLLAWVLGSVARSTSTGGNILSNSEWLVFTIELLPIIVLGLMVMFTLFLIVNSRLLSDALGSGMTQRRKAQKKKSWKIQAIVWITGWAVAIVFLEARCHGIFCNSSSTAQTASTLQQIVSGKPLPSLPVLGTVVAFSSLIDTNIFVFAFIGLLTVGSVIAVRSVIVHLDEVRKEKVEFFEMTVKQGREVVQAAIRIIDQNGPDDPRARILACYQKMINAASDLGAPVGVDKTARELEKGIRNMFLLKGPGIAGLTGLFEEARYSLHPITGQDSMRARECLEEIGAELNRHAMV